MSLLIANIFLSNFITDSNTNVLLLVNIGFVEKKNIFGFFFI